jgi:GTP-binding protein HflX
MERAFLVGVHFRARKRSSVGGKAGGSLTPGTQAARDAATSLTAGSKAPSVPEFSAEESLAELRSLASSAGAEVAGEFLQHRDKPDAATLIGKGKLEGSRGFGRREAYSFRSRSISVAAKEH